MSLPLCPPLPPSSPPYNHHHHQCLSSIYARLWVVVTFLCTWTSQSPFCCFGSGWLGRESEHLSQKLSPWVGMISLWDCCMRSSHYLLYHLESWWLVLSWWGDVTAAVTFCGRSFPSSCHSGCLSKSLLTVGENHSGCCSVFLAMFAMEIVCVMSTSDMEIVRIMSASDRKIVCVTSAS